MGSFWRLFFLGLLGVQLCLSFNWWIVIAVETYNFEARTRHFDDIDGGKWVKWTYGLLWKLTPIIIVWNIAGWYFFLTKLRLAMWLVVYTALNGGALIGLFLPFKIMPEIKNCANPASSALLLAYGRHNWPHSKIPASKACSDFQVEIWSNCWVVILALLTSMVGIISTCFGWESTSRSRSTARRTAPRPWPPWLVQKLLPWLAPIVFFWCCCSRILVPSFSYACKLPGRSYSKLRNFFRHSWRAIKYRRFPTPTRKLAPAGDEETGAMEMSQRRDCVPRDDTTLEKLIRIDDLFFLLCEHMHASDLWALAAVNKRSHAVVKSHWTNNRISLKKILCLGSQKQCMYCDLPVCNGCKPRWPRFFSRTIKEVQKVTLHPVCSWCFFLALGAWRDVFTSRTEHCTSDHAELLQEDKNKYPCQNCQRRIRSVADAERERNKRRKRDITIDATDCCICKKKIWIMPMRWWRCSVCEKECRPQHKK